MHVDLYKTARSCIYGDDKSYKSYTGLGCEAMLVMTIHYKHGQ